MTRAIIFANGDMDNPPTILQELLPGDVIIAADGGTHQCLKAGITPGVIIGDFDSLEAELLDAYEHMGVVAIRYPSHKDETDLELAVQYAQKEGFDEVFILGALGARWDMTLANVLLMAQPGFSAIKIHLLNGRQEFIILRGEEQVELRAKAGDTLSLIPLGGDCHGISTQGLEYPLSDETLNFGSPRGVSNVFQQDIAQVEIREGVLLCIIDRAGA